jgi:hypothetical protein
VVGYSIYHHEVCKNLKNSRIADDPLSVMGKLRIFDKCSNCNDKLELIWKIVSEVSYQGVRERFRVCEVVQNRHYLLSLLSGFFYNPEYLRQQGFRLLDFLCK